jgi:hypothetical protein
MSEKKDHAVTSGSEPGNGDVVREKKDLKTIEEKYADVTLRLVEQHGSSVAPLSLEAEKKLRRKVYVRIMLLLCVINLVLFVSSLIMIDYGD